MHQVAHRYVNGFSRDRLSKVAMRIVLLCENSLDAELLSAGLNQFESLDVVTASADVEFCKTRCQRLHPDLLIVDPNSGIDVVQQAFQLVKIDVVHHLLVLDSQVRQGRLTNLLKMENVSYLTRQCGLEELAASIQQIQRTGRRSFDPAIRDQIKSKPGRLVFQRAATDCALELLTTREREVMILLAQGHSVRSCAQLLELAESTIDNHKSRLMKKLDIHKSVELSHLAIREGLVVVR